MLVHEMMDRDLTSLAEHTTLLEAIALLAAHKAGGLPVLNESGDVVGFITEKDILRAAIPGYFGYMDDNFAMPDIDKLKSRIARVGKEPVCNYMNKDTIVFEEDETISNALVTLFKKNVRIAPVVRNRALVGVVNREEILKSFVHDNFQDGEIEIPAGSEV